MKFGQALAATAAVSLAVAPVAAQAAASGVEGVRSGTQAEGERIGGSLLLPLLALAALAAVLIVALDDDESPASP
jgi:hypothetical protein